MVIIKLTKREAELLSLVAGNGWGDGDFADYLNDAVESTICMKAMEKLDKAIREAGDG